MVVVCSAQRYSCPAGTLTGGEVVHADALANDGPVVQKSFEVSLE